MASASATRTAAALLRQLAGSDAIKAELIEADILDLITRCSQGLLFGIPAGLGAAARCMTASHATGRQWHDHSTSACWM